MKYKILLLTITLGMMSLSAFSQRVYGTFDALSGKITLTNEIAYAKQKLQESLNDPGVVLSNLEILKASDNSVFLLTAEVSNSKDGITAIGVELHLTGNAIHGTSAAAGPGIKHTCHGKPCSSCKFTFRPIGCECRKEGHCDHSTEVVIGI